MHFNSPGDLETSKKMQEEMILAAEEFYQSLGEFLSDSVAVTMVRVIMITIMMIKMVIIIMIVVMIIIIIMMMMIMIMIIVIM